ncbi:MAG: hypothetical protein QXW71_06505 [Thermoplasmata archaeon]
MSELNQTNQEIRYDEKYGFFEYPDGLKLPAVGIFHRYISIYRDFINMQFLYSFKSHQFLPAIVRDYESNNDDNEYPPNVQLTYNVALGEYVLFSIKAKKDIYIRIDAERIEIYAEDVNELLQSQEKITYKTVDDANAIIYYPQLNRLWGLEELSNLLINFTDNIFKKLEANGEYKFEVPKIFVRHGYTWKDIKQLILRLRQPLDPDA